MSTAIDRVLIALNLHPVLVDIGASGEPLRIWQLIAQHSIYIGFDPDQRETHELPPSLFHKGWVVNQAVTSEPDCNPLSFYLTRSPFCSSSLPPDHAALSNYLFADLFAVEKQVTVPTTRLDTVVDRLALAGIHWLKIDSQGTDLRLFNSLGTDLRSRVLTLDIEPGLIDAYQSEDLFCDAHRELTNNGFWLSNLKLEGAVRMRHATLNQMLVQDSHLNRDRIEKSIRPSPGWVEARYFRTMEWAREYKFSKEEYALLWVFALLDGQSGFAFDLATEWEQVFGKDELSELMMMEAILRVKNSRRYWIARARTGIPTQMKRWLRWLLRIN